MKYLSLAVCLMMRNEKPDLRFGPVLEYVKDMKNFASLSIPASKKKKDKAVKGICSICVRPIDAQSLASFSPFTPATNSSRFKSSKPQKPNTGIHPRLSEFGFEPPTKNQSTNAQPEIDFFNVAVQCWSGMCEAESILDRYINSK
jgi:hypothetical protein